MSENRVLASGGRIPWDLPDDVRQFRERTAGRWLLLGRRTWEQMQGWFRPGHVPVVLTRGALDVPGGHAVDTLAGALAVAQAGGAAELVVCGGGQVYAATLPYARELILTTVHATVAGEVTFPDFPPAEWKVLSTVCHPADSRHAHAFTLTRFARILPPCSLSAD